MIAVTQSANERSIRMLRRLGFTERDRFHQFGAEQSLNVAELSAYGRRSDGVPPRPDRAA